MDAKLSFNYAQVSPTTQWPTLETYFESLEDFSVNDFETISFSL